jgi:uncharacterized protein YggU (UPF0235/DUF167 family)
VDYTVRVKPGSSKGPLVEVVDDVLTVYLQQRAVDGQANTALLAVLAKHFDVPKSSLEIVRGFTSRTKVVRSAE